jgi:4-amino-4-deoxy-L-arabinose transferase-like glycosyltransferase
MKIITLLLLSIVLFFNNIGGIALWDPDEPRQAIMAREMMERNDYIHPYLNGKPYLEKPPLYSWAIIAASKMRGSVDEYASRLPAAVSATLLLLSTYFLGSAILGPPAGLISAFVLATNYQFLSNARESVMDMTFAFFIGLTIVCAFFAMRRGKGWLFVLAFLPAGLGILTKGPAALLIPACIVFIYLIVQKEMKRFILPLVIGSLLATAIASLWFIAAGEEYIEEFIFRQNFTRYMNAFDHWESVFYYFHKLFFNFLPWSMLLPFALYHAYKKKYWLPLIWFGFTFLFFEISTSKRAIYLLCCYPACALLCGLYIKDAWSSLVTGRVTGLVLKLFAGLFTLLPLAAAVLLFSSSDPTVAVFRQGPMSTYFFIGAVFLAGLSFFYLLARKSEKGALAAFFVYLTIGGFFYGAGYMPIMDKQYKSPRLITDHLTNFKKKADVYTFGFSSAGFIYYIGKPVQTFFDINKIKNDKNDILVIVEDAQAPMTMRKVLEQDFIAVGKSRYEREYYTFYVRNNGR